MFWHRCRWLESGISGTHERSDDLVTTIPNESGEMPYDTMTGWSMRRDLPHLGIPSTIIDNKRCVS
jgi:hypothetical protein